MLATTRPRSLRSDQGQSHGRAQHAGPTTERLIVPLNLKIGDRFPDHTLTDDTGTALSISEVANGRPLFLALFRGPW